MSRFSLLQGIKQNGDSAYVERSRSDEREEIFVCFHVFSLQSAAVVTDTCIYLNSSRMAATGCRRIRGGTVAVGQMASDTLHATMQRRKLKAGCCFARGKSWRLEMSAECKRLSTNAAGHKASIFTVFFYSPPPFTSSRWLLPPLAVNSSRCLLNFDYWVNHVSPAGRGLSTTFLAPSLSSASLVLIFSELISSLKEKKNLAYLIRAPRWSPRMCLFCSCAMERENVPPTFQEDGLGDVMLQHQSSCIKNEFAGASFEKWQQKWVGVCQRLCVAEKEEEEDEEDEEEDWEPPAHTNLPLKNCSSLSLQLPPTSPYWSFCRLLLSGSVSILHLWSCSVTFLLIPFSFSSPTQPLHLKWLCLARQAIVSADTSGLVGIFEAINSSFGWKSWQLPRLLLPAHYILQVQGSEILYNLSKEIRATVVNIFNYYKGGASSGSTNSCTSCLFPPHIIQSCILCPCLVSHAGDKKTPTKAKMHASLFKTHISETEASGISVFSFFLSFL